MNFFGAKGPGPSFLRSLYFACNTYTFEDLLAALFLCYDHIHLTVDNGSNFTVKTTIVNNFLS